jgi:hypothetical protein
MRLRRRDLPALIGLVTLGTLLRWLHFLGRPSLSLDEARLALNIGTRTYRGLVHPLGFDQSAPLFYLWAERLATGLFGVNEFALRAVALLAGIGALAVSSRLFERFVSRDSALVGVAILAVAPAMVVYSNEVKQYMLEALVAILVILSTLQWLEAPGLRTGVRLGVVGVVAVWMSGSAVFVLAGVGPAIALGRSERQRVPVRMRVAILAAWALSFSFAYFLIYHAASANAYMLRFWGPAFLTPAPGLGRRFWLAGKDMVWGFLVGHSGVPAGPDAEVLTAVFGCLGLAAVLGGAHRVWKRSGGQLASVLLGPPVVTLLASALGLYPFSQRLVLFTVPLLVALAVAGFEGVVALDGGRWRRGWLVVVVGLGITPLLAVSLLESGSAGGGSRMRSLTEDFRRRHTAGEAVYIFGRALPGWAFYTTDWSHPDLARLTFFERLGESGGAGFENAPSRGRAVLRSDADHLIYATPAGQELVGIPTGMEFMAGRGLTQYVPDSGWVEREADRIEEAASPTVWVVLAEFFGPEYRLIDELKRRGARASYIRIEPGHVLIQYDIRPLAAAHPGDIARAAPP